MTNLVMAAAGFRGAGPFASHPMNLPLPFEIVCPRCRIEVQPIEAVGQWFCPHCAWEFLPEQIAKARQEQDQADDDSSAFQ